MKKFLFQGLKVRVASIVEKAVQNRLRWFGHVERRPVDSVLMRVV